MFASPRRPPSLSNPFRPGPPGRSSRPRNRAPVMWKFHGWFERNSLILIIGIVIAISIGGIIEIVPLFYLESTIEKVQGVRPYTPLELEGRDVYSSEGCVGCHSQMIRPL